MNDSLKQDIETLVKLQETESEIVRLKAVLDKVEKEKLKITAQIKEINQHILRKDKLLSNDNYTKKAPAAVVEKEKQSLLELKQEIEKLEKIKSALK